MADGLMLSSVTPRPMSIIADRGLAAISPHTATGSPRRAAASVTRRTRARIAGWKGW
jgi:hypothetical protein